MMGKAIPVFGIVLLVFGMFVVWFTDPVVQKGRESAYWNRQARESLALERQQQRAELQMQVDAVAVPVMQIVFLAVASTLLIGIPALLGVGAIAFFRRRHGLVYPDAQGRIPLRLDDAAYQGIAAAALAAFHQVDHERARQSRPVPLHYAPSLRYDVQTPPVVSGAARESSAAAAVVSDALPGLTDLADLAHQPSSRAILLGLGPGGGLITVPLRSLWHIGLAGATGTGKSNIARLIVAQLLALGAQVSIADPKFTRYDAESGEDWRLIADRLHLAPASRAGDIADVLSWHSDELARRLERRQQGQPVGTPLFLYLDEWHVIAADVPDAEAAVQRLARIGRGVGLFLLAAAHSMLMKDSASFRDQFRTGFYLGGQRKSGAALLDLPEREIDESQCTLGVAYLRSSATMPARLVRVPYASNTAVAELLTDRQPTMERTARQQPVHPTDDVGENPAPPDPAVTSSRSPADVEPKTTSRAAPCARPSAEVVRVLDLFAQGRSINDIAQDVYGVPKSGGKSVDARRKVEAIIRQSLVGVQR